MSEVLVIKLGGTTIADQRQVLGEVAAVARQRPVVLVHGGGKRITEWLERLGVPSKFEGGLRVTDAQSLEVAAAVLRGVVNSELVSGLRDLGVDAVGLSGVDGGQGGPVAFDRATAREAMNAPEVVFSLDLGLGTGRGEAFGCDLTETYVIENSEYTT